MQLIISSLFKSLLSFVTVSITLPRPWMESLWSKPFTVEVIKYCFIKWYGQFHCNGWLLIGINVRYLGKIVVMLSKVTQLEYVYVIGVSELIVRAAKHIFTSYMQSVEMMGLSAAIAHFLNCFLGSNTSPVF